MVYEPRPEEGSPLESAIREFDAYVSDETNALQARRVLEWARNGLQEIQTRADVAPPHRTVRYLFDLYFRFQYSLQDHPDAGHILRVVGDDFAAHVGYDLDEAWQDYQDALDAHN